MPRHYCFISEWGIFTTAYAHPIILWMTMLKNRQTVRASGALEVARLCLHEDEKDEIFLWETAIEITFSNCFSRKESYISRLFPDVESHEKTLLQWEQ